MSQQLIGLGTTANDGTGDTLRAAGAKINANFTELYGRLVSAATDPTANDDSGDGYQVGTIWINTSTGVVFVARDVSAGAAVWEPLPADRLSINDNEFWTPFIDDHVQTGAIGGNQLRLVGFRPKQRMIIDQFGPSVNTTDGAINIKAGLWANHPTNRVPTGSPLATIASAAASSQAMIAALVGGGTLTLSPELIYWFGEVHSGNLDKVSHTASMNLLFGAPLVTHLFQGAFNRGWYYQVAHTYANALPDLTTGVTWSSVRQTGSGPAVPVFRVSDATP